MRWITALDEILLNLRQNYNGLISVLNLINNFEITKNYWNYNYSKIRYI